MIVSLEALQYISYICYLVQFQENKIHALIHFGNKVNTMTLAYEAKLGLISEITSVGAHKIASSPLKTYNMALASFML